MLQIRRGEASATSSKDEAGPRLKKERNSGFC